MMEWIAPEIDAPFVLIETKKVKVWTGASSRSVKSKGVRRKQKTPEPSHFDLLHDLPDGLGRIAIQDTQVVAFGLTERWAAGWLPIDESDCGYFIFPTGSAPYPSAPDHQNRFFKHRMEQLRSKWRPRFEIEVNDFEMTLMSALAIPTDKDERIHLSLDKGIYEISVLDPIEADPDFVYCRFRLKTRTERRSTRELKRVARRVAERKQETEDRLRCSELAEALRGNDIDAIVRIITPNDFVWTDEMIGHAHRLSRIETDPARRLSMLQWLRHFRQSALMSPVELAWFISPHRDAYLAGTYQPPPLDEAWTDPELIASIQSGADLNSMIEDLQLRIRALPLSQQIYRTWFEQPLEDYSADTAARSLYYQLRVWRLPDDFTFFIRLALGAEKLSLSTGRRARLFSILAEFDEESVAAGLDSLPAIGPTHEFIKCTAVSRHEFFSSLREIIASDLLRSAHFRAWLARLLSTVEGPVTIADLMQPQKALERLSAAERCLSDGA